MSFRSTYRVSFVLANEQATKLAESRYLGVC